MKKAKVLLIPLLTVMLTTSHQASAATIKPRFTDIKNDYIIAYSYSPLNKNPKRYDLTILTLITSGKIYTKQYEDYVTAQIPIEKFSHHALADTKIDKIINYYQKIASQKPIFGNFYKNPKSILIIEARSNNKTFTIKVDDFTNFYTTKKVSESQLNLRKEVIEKLNQYYQPELAKPYQPSKYNIVATKVNEKDILTATALNTAPKIGCYAEKSIDMGEKNYTGFYEYKNITPQYYYLYIKPSILDINLCN